MQHSATQPAAHNSTSCTTGVKVALFHEDLLCVEENLPSGHRLIDSVALWPWPGIFPTRTLIKPKQWLHKLHKASSCPYIAPLYPYWSRLYSETYIPETYIRKLIQLYSETYILQLIKLSSETNVQGLYSETYIPKLLQMYSETNDRN